MTMSNNPIFKTDAYEFTMVSSLVEEGRADVPAVCELFARRLPQGRRFGMQAGLGRVLAALESYEVTPDHIEKLEELHLITPSTAGWLSDRLGGPLFNGTLRAYREGDLYHPYSPIVQVEGALGEILLLETFLLSIYNHDSAVASAAARMVLASGGRPIIEMGSRRTDDEAALSAARAAYIAGFASTSNVEAAVKYGIPTAGTAAHAFTLSHATEEEAFRAQMKTWGTDTTLLVDTYDIAEGIRTGVRVARELGKAGPRAIRIDSGDLLEETEKARKLLDELGAVATKIVVSSDLDEYLMTELAAAPIDGYGAGTRVVTGSGHPTAGMVYKLVEVEGVAVAKKSADKGSIGGRKTSYRLPTGGEFFSVSGTVRGEALQEVYVRNGVVVKNPTLSEVRDFAAATLAQLPSHVKSVAEGEAWQKAQIAEEEK